MEHKIWVRCRSYFYFERESCGIGRSIDCPGAGECWSLAISSYYKGSCTYPVILIIVVNELMYAVGGSGEGRHRESVQAGGTYRSGFEEFKGSEGPRGISKVYF